MKIDGRGRHRCTGNERDASRSVPGDVDQLAARKGADPASIKRLLDYLDAREKGLRRWPLADRGVSSSSPSIGRRNWKTSYGNGRPGADSENRWRLALGYLLAEQGKVAEAIKLFEAVEAADELSPAPIAASRTGTWSRTAASSIEKAGPPSTRRPRNIV